MCLTCAFTKYKVTTSKFTHCSASHALCPIFEGFLIVPCLSFRRSSSHLPRIQHYIHALIRILALCGLFCICPFVFKLMACRSSLLEGDAQTSRFIDCEMNKNDLSIVSVFLFDFIFIFLLALSLLSDWHDDQRIHTSPHKQWVKNRPQCKHWHTDRHLPPDLDLLDLRLLVLLQSLHAYWRMITNSW